MLATTEDHLEEDTTMIDEALGLAQEGTTTTDAGETATITTETASETIEEEVEETEMTATIEEAGETTETGIVAETAKTETAAAEMEEVLESKYSALAMLPDHLHQKEQYLSPNANAQRRHGISRLLALKASLLPRQR